jgi:hypothetical protein
MAEALLTLQPKEGDTLMVDKHASEDRLEISLKGA